MNIYSRLAVLLLVLCSVSSCRTTRVSKRPPNVIIIFADDMGYGDMSNSGHPSIRTPHLDAMAFEGQKWTNFYAAAPVCTPSRAALMTGRYPIRNGLCSSKRYVFFPDAKGGMPASETTIAEVLKSRGYATGMVGKWHLGHLPEYLPTNHGFDSWYGIPYSNDMDPQENLIKEANGTAEFRWFNGKHWDAPKSDYWNVPLMDGEQILERAPDQTQLTKDYTRKSLQFIRANKDRPFFLYLAHSMPHVPLFRSKEFENISTGGLYGDVIEELDWSVGQVLSALRAEGLEKNTLVVFTSDNGPWLLFEEQGGLAGPFRSGKGNTWEGGMREPAIFWWPGTVKPGVVHGIGSTLDLMATVASLSGAQMPSVTHDSHDLSRTLKFDRPSPRTDMLYHNGHHLHAVRVGNFKTHFITRAGWGADRIYHDTPLVYDLALDPGESRNVADEHPEAVAAARIVREKFRASLAPVENQLEK